MASRRRQRVDLYLLGRGIVDGVSQMTIEEFGRTLDKSEAVTD